MSRRTAGFVCNGYQALEGAVNAVGGAGSVPGLSGGASLPELAEVAVAAALAGGRVVGARGPSGVTLKAAGDYVLGIR